jgi:hypothetical protein
VASEGITDVLVYADERNAAVPYVLKTGFPSRKCGMGTESEGRERLCSAVAGICGAERSMTIRKVLSLVSVEVLRWSSTVEKEYERPSFAAVRGCVGLLVALVLDLLTGADNFSELCESDQMLRRASKSFTSPDASSLGRNALFGGVSGMNANGVAWAGNCCCFCAGLVTMLAISQSLKQIVSLIPQVQHTASAHIAHSETSSFSRVLRKLIPVLCGCLLRSLSQYLCAVLDPLERIASLAASIPARRIFPDGLCVLFAGVRCDIC